MVNGNVARKRRYFCSLNSEGASSMQVCDFAHSFLTFRIDLLKKQPITVSHKPPFTLNNARLPLECRCQVTFPDSGQTREYVLTASCKTERVNVPEDIWTQPNADMCAVATPEDFLIIKSWDRNNKGVKLYPPSLGDQPERQVTTVAEALDRLRIDVRLIEGKVLEKTEQIVEAVHANRPLVSRTEYTTDDGLHVLLEYPVKTINASERENFYQIDTGPVLFVSPPGGQGENPIARLRHAFIAHNAPDWAELLVNVPTPLADGISVNHYSKAVRVTAKNSMMVLD
jgi:hypothetical protein